MREIFIWPKQTSIEVTTKLGESIKQEMSEARHLAMSQRRKPIGWAMSAHAYLSLHCWFIENFHKQQRIAHKEFEYEGLPIFIHDSLAPFILLFSPEEAGRMEYEARNKP